MTKTIMILHFTPPGVVGGVEQIMREHVGLLTGAGYSVEVIAGRDAESSFPLHVIPEIDAAREESSRIEAQLAAGAVYPIFRELSRVIEKRLVELVSDADVFIVHNAFTLHFSLPLTAALFRWCAGTKTTKVIAWCHDLSWTNPLYLPALHDAYPWNLLRTPAPRVAYVTVSEVRRRELLGLWQNEQAEVTVVPNGIDPGHLLRLSQVTENLAESHRLYDRDLVLYVPVRITRRKNLETAIQVAYRLREQGLDVCLLVSGPQAPHHPLKSQTYLSELQALRDQLHLKNHVFFLSAEIGENLDANVVSELYALVDVVLLPSEQEGFGLPVIEAAANHLPVVASDIPVFREVGGDACYFFKLDDDPSAVAALVGKATSNNPGRLFRSTLRHYRWDAVMTNKIIPLLTPALDG